MNFWAGFFFFFSSLFVFSQNYELKTYSIADGLPQSQVYDIAEDHNGNLWLGTRGGGLAKFDGQDFQVFTTQEGLVNNYISSVFHDSRNNIWIGTSNGVSLFNGIRFRNFKLEDEAFKISVSSITENKSKEIFFGTSNGVYKRSEKSNTNISKEIGLPGNSITDVYVDSLDNLWIAHNKGFTSWGKDGAKHYVNDELARVFPQCFAEDKHQVIWVGTYGKGLVRVREDKLHFIEQTDKLVILDIYKEGDLLWLSTLKNGILIFNTKTLALNPIDNAETLPTSNCRKVFKDSWGGIWFGTSGGGLIKYVQPEIKSFEEKDGFKGKYIYTVAPALDSGVWVSTNARKLFKCHSEIFEEYGLEKNIYPQKIKSILEDSRGRLWLGTEGSGLMMWKDGRTKFYREGGHLGASFVKDIVEDKKGFVWVATSNGVSRFSPELSNVKFFTKGNGNLHFNRVNCLHVDRSNRLWYGTRGKGVGCISEEANLVFDKSKGLSDDVIRDLDEDRLGNLFIATADGGVDVLAIYSEGFPVKNINTRKGASFNNVYSVFCDAENQIWLGGAKGVNRIENPTKKDRVIKTYGIAEGFLGMETNQGAVCTDLKGNIWWGTINGVMMKPNFEIQSKKMPPKISISSVNLFYKNIQGTKYEPNILNWYETGDLIFDFKDNHIGFELDGNDLARPEDIRYLWRLDGGDGRWSPPVKQNEVFFSNLSPGRYIFQAKAINKDGVESEMIEFYFAVAAPFYYKIWFWTAIALVLIGIVVLVVKKRVNSITQKANEEAEKLRLEKEVLEMEQKALRLQMNPHFIFNALNAIQDQIRVEDNKGARHSLSKFSKLMRQILDSSRSDCIALELELNILENYLNIEKLTRNQSFDYKIILSEDIDPEEEGIPPMMIQPFIENAIIHGIAAKNEKGEIIIDFRLKGELLIITISDNGIGREKAKALKSQVDQQHKSVALEVIQSRLENLSKDQIKSQYQIEDIISDDEVKGTKVTLTINRQTVF